MSEPVIPTRLTQEALLAGLASRAGELSDEAHRLRESYRFSRWLKATLAIGVLMLAANGVMLGILIAVANTNRDNGNAIRSCTTPSGDCYQRGQENTTAAIGQIVAGVNTHTDLVLVTSLRCSRTSATDGEFERCVEDRLTSAAGVQP